MKRAAITIVLLVASVTILFSQSGGSQKLTADDIVIYKDIVYASIDGHELKLDLAVPKYLKTPAPAIVDFPGGAWRICNKSADDARFYAKYGFIGVSVEYRTSDIALFPAAVHDCKTAIRWLRAHAGNYQIDTGKIGVTGISAGGYLAAMLGTSGGDRYLEGTGGFPEYSSAVQAVVDHFGPTDFLTTIDTTGLGLRDFNNDQFSENSPAALFLGGIPSKLPEKARQASPITYIDPNDPPTLIGHGEKDGMVVITHSQLFFDALKKAGIPTEFVRVKNADHQYRPYRWDVSISPSVAEISERTIRWFQQWLGTPDLDVNMIQKVQKGRGQSDSSKNYRLYYKLIIDLPGKSNQSYCIGRFMVLCEGKTLAQGEISMQDLSTQKKRTSRKEFSISGIDLRDKNLMWNFRGEIYDASFPEKFEPMYMQGEIFDDTIEGIGFTIRVGDDKSFHISKVVFRK